jgi:acid phosphatase (class A)
LPQIQPEDIMARKLSIWAVSLCLLAGGAALAQPASKPAAVSKFLKPGELDPAVLIGPPPEDGSPRQLAEAAELVALAAARTPDRLAKAEHDAAAEDATSILAVFGPAVNLNDLPATARLLADVRNEDDVASKSAKVLFHRNRPWISDATLAASPALEPCAKGDAKASYPSGHATMGYAAAGVLAQLMPGNARIILARGAEYAESRLICGVHYRSDTEAGHVLATALIAKLMTKPAFMEEFDAAKAELEAAHLAP